MQGGLAQGYGQGKACLIEDAFASKIPACAVKVLLLDFLHDCAGDTMKFGVALAYLVTIFFGSSDFSVGQKASASQGDEPA